jgi:hypothetical protein
MGQGADDGSNFTEEHSGNAPREGSS